MSQLSDNLSARRESLGYTVTDVHQRLNRMGHQVAFSTVAGWFNGSRGVRGMKHLRALCEVLQTDLNSLAGDEIEVAEDGVEIAIMRELRELSPAQREAVLGIIGAMRKGG